jgi:hypothetical protein
MNSSQLFTVCIVATAEEAPVARPLCVEWHVLINPHSRVTVAEMLPTPLRPKGSKGAPTKWMCANTFTGPHAAHMQAFIISRPVPVVATVVGPQEDTMAARLANRDRFLEENDWEIVPIDATAFPNDPNALRHF